MGVIANAAVKAGWVALEECWSEKTGSDAVYYGRADLWLWQKGRHERIEAKFTSDGFSELKLKIPRRHDSAKKEAAKLGRVTDAENIALTFIVPRVRHSEQKDFEKSVSELTNRCMDLSPEIFGSVFPGIVPRLGSDQNEKEKFALGIIVIGNVV